MTDLITRELVRLDTTWGDDKLDVIRGLAAVVGDAGRAADTEQLVADAFAREETSSTGLPGGIAIPHCRTTGVDEPTLAFARLRPRVDFGAKDGPADLAFLIAAPAGGDATHLQLLTKLARSLVKPSFTNALREAEDADEVVALINQALDVPDPARPRQARPASGTPDGTPPGVRPAPTGGRRRRTVPPPPRRPEVAGRRHRLPDRHRAHLHGRRGPRGRRRAGRGRDRGRDPGLGRQHAPRLRDDLPGRRGDLRRRRRACATAAASPASPWSAPA